MRRNEDHRGPNALQAHCRTYRRPPSGGSASAALGGARARGVADGLEWLGLAAVLLDDRGEVLHVNAGAIELMGEDLFLQGGRLRARDGTVDAELSAAITLRLAGASRLGLQSR